MKVETLNEELQILDNGRGVVLLIDYKRKAFEVFKNYEDKTFSSIDIMTYFDLITAARDLGKAKLNPEVCKAPEKMEVIKDKGNETKRQVNFKERVCAICHNPFIPSGARQSICTECKVKFS